MQNRPAQPPRHGPPLEPPPLSKRQAFGTHVVALKNAGGVAGPGPSYAYRPAQPQQGYAAAQPPRHGPPLQPPPLQQPPGAYAPQAAQQAAPQAAQAGAPTQASPHAQPIWAGRILLVRAASRTD